MFSWHKYVGPALLAMIVAGCNGQEESISQQPLDAISSFDPSDACAPRIIGLLQSSKVVENIGYRCDDYVGYTGRRGLAEEQAANWFVCPLSAQSVTFLVGGRTASLDLGTAYFRRASSKNINPESGNIECTYDVASESYADGAQYDAAGPYLFSFDDLSHSPARIDVTVAGGTDEAIAQNSSALLTGLDRSAATDAVLEIDDVAHSLIFNEQFDFPQATLELDFADFVASDNVAQSLLDEVFVNGGTVGVLPSNETETEADITAASLGTASGIYTFQLLDLVYGLLYFSDPDAPPVPQEVLVTSTQVDGRVLPFLAFSDSVDINCATADSTDPACTDLVILESLNEFFPLMFVDRLGRVSGGGIYDYLQLADLQGGPSTPLCDNELPDYFNLSGASLGADLSFNNMVLKGAFDIDTDVEMSGRYLNARAYNGVSTDPDDPAALSDFSLDYPNLPASAYTLDKLNDRTIFNAGGSICGQVIAEQPIFGLERGGIFQPKLDEEVMSLFFSVAQAYTMTYLHRTTVDGEINTELDTLDVLIYEDGTIITNITGAGISYDPASPSTIPVGEYMIGTVSSVVRAEGEAAAEAELNIVLFNFAELSEVGALPMYGSHFRARLLPDTVDACDNRLFAASDEAVAAGSLAHWYDPYSVVEHHKTNLLATNSDNFAFLRTRAYGFVESKLTSCPPVIL